MAARPRRSAPTSSSTTCPARGLHRRDDARGAAGDGPAAARVDVLEPLVEACRAARWARLRTRRARCRRCDDRQAARRARARGRADVGKARVTARVCVDNHGSRCVLVNKHKAYSHVRAPPRAHHYTYADPKVNRLEQMLRVGMRLRQPAVTYRPASSWMETGRLSTRKTSGTCCCWCPTRRNCQPRCNARPAARSAACQWRWSRICSPTPTGRCQGVCRAQRGGRGDEPSPMIRSRARRRRPSSAGVAGSSSDEEGPVFKARKAAMRPRRPAREEAKAKAAAEAAAAGAS